MKHSQILRVNILIYLFSSKKGDKEVTGHQVAYFFYPPEMKTWGQETDTQKRNINQR